MTPYQMAEVLRECVRDKPQAVAIADRLCSALITIREARLPGGASIIAALAPAPRHAADKTIRELQTSLPWTIRYSRDYRASPTTHKDFTHALLHVGKALGKLMALADDMDHDREVADDSTLRDRHAKYVADLVVCALRAANVFPGGVMDLQAAVEGRIVEKNAPPAPVVAGATTSGVA